MVEIMHNKSSDAIKAGVDEQQTGRFSQDHAELIAAKAANGKAVRSTEDERAKDDCIDWRKDLKGTKHKGKYLPEVKSFAEPDQRVVDILNTIKPEVIKQRLNELSGNDEVVINGERTRIATRNTNTHEYEKGLNYFKEKLENDGFKVTIDTYKYRGEEHKNMRAVKIGTTNPNEVILMGSHIDNTAGEQNSREELAPGADDDGSGSVSISMIADAYKNIKLGKTVVLAMFSGEEQGLKGSTAMAKRPDILEGLRTGITNDLKEAGVVMNEPAKINAMIQMDMVAYEPDGNTVESHDHVGKNGSREIISNVLKENAQRYGIPVQIWVPEDEDPLASRSDNKAFEDKGIPVTLVCEKTEPFNPNYHSTNDTVDTLNIAHMTNVDKLVAATGIQMAGGIK